MAKAGIKITKDADGEGAEGVGDLSIGGEAESGEMIDNIADKGNAEHDWHLFPFTLVDDDETKGERRHKDEFEPKGHFGVAGGFTDGVFIDAAVE